MIRLFVILVASSAQAELPKTLTISEALKLAMERQPTLAVAKANVEVAKARSREAYAPLLPTVGGSLAYSRQTANFVPRPGSVPSSVSTGSTITLNSSDFWNANVSAQWTAWDFFQNQNRYESVLSQEQVQIAQLHLAEVGLQLQVRAAFFDAQSKKDLVSVAKATLANTEAHLLQVQGFVQVGTRPQIDLAQSRVDRANAKLLAVNSKNDYATARARLNQAMGYEGPDTYEIITDEPTPLDGEGETLEGLLPEALKNRPEAGALEAQLASQVSIIKSVHGAFYPSLGIGLGATLGAADLTRPVPNLNGQITISWPFYSGGLTTAQEREAQASLAGLQAQVNSLRLQVRLDVEQALLGLGAAKESVEVAEEAREASQERLTLAQGRYAAGAGSAIELGDAQVAFTSAAAQKVQAIANVAVARAKLIAALGRP